LYAVILQAVSQRTQQIGLRIALGATRGDIAGLVFRQGIPPLVPGLVIGLLLALGATKVSRSLLMGVSPNRQARDDRVRQDTEVADYVVLRSLRCEPALKNERPASLPSRGRRAARSEAGGTKRNRVYLCLPAAGRGTSPLCVTNGIWWREKGRCGGAKRESGAARDETSTLRMTGGDGSIEGSTGHCLVVRVPPLQASKRRGPLRLPAAGGIGMTISDAGESGIGLGVGVWFRCVVGVCRRGFF